jgi:hypothetical protein
MLYIKQAWFTTPMRKALGYLTVTTQPPHVLNDIVAYQTVFGHHVLTSYTTISVNNHLQVHLWERMQLFKVDSPLTKHAK